MFPSETSIQHHTPSNFRHTADPDNDDDPPDHPHIPSPTDNRPEDDRFIMALIQLAKSLIVAKAQATDFSAPESNPDLMDSEN